MRSSFPEDADVPAEVLEFFIPEAEEHLQTVTECLLVLEAHPNPEDINRLFRSMHTIKGSAAQVGLHRLSAVAHRVEDLIGRMRDAGLQPSAQIVDICLQSVDILKKFLHRLWTSDAEMAAAVNPLLSRIAASTPGEVLEETPVPQTEDTPHKNQTAFAETQSPDPRDSPAAAPAHAFAAGPLPQTKSVRISLERLDRMMNAVGELVINRTRMLGRLGELSKLVDVLTISRRGGWRGRYPNFRRSTNSIVLVPPLCPEASPRRKTRFEPDSTPIAPANVEPIYWNLAEPSKWTATTISNILSRSLTEISADVNEVLAQLETFMGLCGFRYRRIRQARPSSPGRNHRRAHGADREPVHQAFPHRSGTLPKPPG